MDSRNDFGNKLSKCALLRVSSQCNHIVQGLARYGKINRLIASEKAHGLQLGKLPKLNRKLAAQMRKGGLLTIGRM